jgi:hypothetical protein
MASQLHAQPAAATPEPGHDWTAYLPILQWLPYYDRAALRPDLIAGVTVAAFAIPQSMAYAGLVGLPPERGTIPAVIAAWQQRLQPAARPDAFAAARGGADAGR